MDALLGTAAIAATDTTAAVEAAPADWQWKVALIFLPMVLYGVMMSFCRFPVSERVAAGVSDRDMLRELGWGGAYIASALMSLELFRVFGVYDLFAGAGVDLGDTGKVAVALVFAVIPAAAFGAAIGWAFGNKLLVFLLLVMCPLATTELGTDSWIADIMTPVVNASFDTTVGGGLVLIYTSFIMMVLRFFAGPIVHSISPLGLLAVSSAVAAVGLAMLAGANTALIVFVAATVYGFGKSFFWPTMLGVVAEQAPRGGALTLNVTGGVGMLAVGTVGAVFTGYFSEVNAAEALADNPAAVQPVEGTDTNLIDSVVKEQSWVFGSYQGIDPKVADTLPESQQQAVTEAKDEGKQAALMNVALFPVLMLMAYIGLILYFRSRGGYAAVELTEGHDGPVTERDEELAGAVPGPVR